MTTWLRDWVTGLTGAAIVATVALAVTPEGTVKKMVRLAVGLVLLLMTVKPLLTAPDISAAWAGERQASNQAAADGEVISQGLQMELIERELSAYILSKGQQLGLSLDVEVAVTWVDGAPSVSGVSIASHGGDVRAVETMTRWLSDECGLPVSLQHWRR